MPWSKYRWASSEEVVILRWKFPRPSYNAAPWLQSARVLGTWAMPGIALMFPVGSAGALAGAEGGGDLLHPATMTIAAQVASLFRLGTAVRLSCNASQGIVERSSGNGARSSSAHP